MSAKEMFEELGYKEYSNDNLSLSYRKKSKRERINYMVVFYFSDNSYQIFSQSYSSKLLKEKRYLPIYEPYRIDKEMHKAINQQCKELGWYE